jgi:hypothetical protein
MKANNANGANLAQALVIWTPRFSWLTNAVKHRPRSRLHRPHSRSEPGRK